MFRAIFPKLTDEQLRRVIDAPVETWTWGVVFDDCGRRCFVGHVADVLPYAPGEDFPAGVYAALDQLRRAATMPTWRIGGRFDRMARRFGLPRVVRALKIRALATLEARDRAPALTL